MYEETPQENKRTLDFSATSRITAELRRTNNSLEKGKEKHKNMKKFGPAIRTLVLSFRS